MQKVEGAKGEGVQKVGVCKRWECAKGGGVHKKKKVCKKWCAKNGVKRGSEKREGKEDRKKDRKKG